MSTLKTHNLQSPDSGSANIALAPNAGMVVAGVSTFNSAISGTTGSFSQNIAIRLSSATNNLHVHQDDSDKSILQFSNNTTGTATGDGFQIGISGDEEAVIDMKESKPIIFSSAGSERLRISSTGLVGIGTAIPSGKLNLVGSDSQIFNIVQDTGDLTIRLNDRGSSSSYIKIPDGSGALTFETGGSERLRIKSDGKVGIGTDNPTQIFNICGTNVKPVIGHRTEHTPLYSSYNGQNNTSLEITSSGTGTNVAGLTINNPTTSVGTSYKTISFSCSGTSSAEKRAAIISSNHDADGSSSLKGNFYVSTNNGSGLQQNLQINHNGYVTKPNNAMFKVRRTSNQTVNSNGWVTIQFNNKTATNCFDIGGNFNTGNHRFTAPVNGYYQFGLNQRIDGGDGDYFRVAFSLNGDVGASNNYPYGHAIYRDVDGFAYYSFSITSLIYLTAGQYVRAEAYAHSDTTWYIQDESLFYGYLVG